MKVLSSNNSSLRITLIIFLVVFGAIFCSLIEVNLAFVKALLVISVLVFGVYFIHRRYTYLYNLFYDHEYLMLRNRKGERKIELEKISRISYLSGKFKVLGISYQEYRVSFTNEENMSEYVDFYIKEWGDALSEFEELLKRKSPSTTIDNRTH